MLVLSRKAGEKIVLTVGGRTVTLTVVEIDRNKMRLGIQAPKSIPVFRRELVPELWEAIQEAARAQLTRPAPPGPGPAAGPTPPAGADRGVPEAGPAPAPEAGPGVHPAGRPP